MSLMLFIDLDNVLDELYDLDNVHNKLFDLDNVLDELYDLDNVPVMKLIYHCFYFQKYEFKYCFGSKTILRSVKLLTDHHEKVCAVPAGPSGPTVLASEALSNIGAEIVKATDKSKKRRLETLDREGVDRQNNDKRIRQEIEDEESQTLTGQSGVDVIGPPSSASEVEDGDPTPLTPHKGTCI